MPPMPHEIPERRESLPDLRQGDPEEAATFKVTIGSVKLQGKGWRQPYHAHALRHLFSTEADMADVH